MIRKLSKPAVIYRACKINLNKHRKIKKIAKAMELGTFGTLAILHTGELIKSPVADTFVRTTIHKNSLYTSKLPQYNIMGPFTYNPNTKSSLKEFLFDISQKPISKSKQATVSKLPNDIVYQKRIITKMMEDEKNFPKNIDKDKLASTIINVSNELGADPITIACIIKRESKFKTGLENSGARGLMQINKITVKDMYQKGRDKLYHEILNTLKADHPTYSSLYADLRTQDSINIKTGTISYLMKLNESKGNVRKALENYNSSKHKKAYAEDVLNNIKKYSLEFKKLKEETNNLTAKT